MNLISNQVGNMKKLVWPLITLFLLSSCGVNKEEEPETVYTACGEQSMIDGLCIRYMDRDIYFARNIFTEAGNNDEFDVESVKENLDSLAINSGLGEGYFRYHMADKSELDIILEETLYPVAAGRKFKSFIQIWEDVSFNELYDEVGSADPNSILIVNQANKRQFFIVLRASCFTSNNQNCTNNVLANFTPTKGLQALVGRSFARLIGVPTKDCILYPTHPMCATTPSDDQWDLTQSIRFYDLFNNQLETIRNNKGYYDIYYPN